MRSCIDLQANEAAFQAWYATAVVAEFGLARVYREIHVTRDRLAELAPNAIRLPDLTEKGNEFFPDLSVSMAPAVDARHTATRDPALQHAGVMLNRFSIVTEFKATDPPRNQQRRKQSEPICRSSRCLPRLTAPRPPMVTVR